MRALCATVLLTAGCSYPDFGFAPDARGDDTDGSVADGSGVADSSSDSSADSSLAEAQADSGPTDARADTSGGDATPDTVKPDTAAPDLGPEVAPPCATLHFFCDDFDTSAKVTDPWEGSSIVGGGTATYDTALFVTTPRSFASRFVDTAAGKALATLNKTIPVASPSVVTRIEADVYLEDATHPQPIDIFKLQTPSGTGKGLGLVVTPTGYGVETLGTTYNFYPLSKPLPTSKWFRLRLDAVLKQVDGSFTLSVDGDVVASASAISTLDVDVSTRFFSLGMYTDSLPITTFTVRYDNVSLDNL